jgi:selenocysteine lyase/cysteine desulfurase
VQTAGAVALATRAYPAGITPNDFFAPAERVRQKCARLVNANAENVALVSSATSALAIATHNLRVRAGQNVVMLAEQFPSNVYAWRAWQKEGVEMRFAARPNAVGSWTDNVLAALDANTALVAVEQAHWTDGTLLDLAAIGEAARRVGAAFVVDATQTAGVMPLDCAALKPDLLVAHSYKCMLANYGLGFVVIGERFADARPVEQSWLMRAGSDNFARLIDYQDDYAAGARRFDTSTRANPVLINMLEAACDLLLEWQPARIREYLLSISRAALADLAQQGLTTLPEHARAANIFGVALPASADPERIRVALAAKRIHVSVRGTSVRVSPHVYNDASDLERFAAALKECFAAA